MNMKLSSQEQDALARRYAKERDPRDARRLVLANLGLVICIARGMGGRDRNDWMDLVQEGNAGLMVAIERSDPNKGAALATYASIWIRAFILRHLMENGRIVRATTTREGRRRFFDRTLPADVSLDAPAASDGEPRKAAALDHVSGDDSLRPDVAAEARDELHRVRRAVARLEETLGARERVILRSRLLCDSPAPLRQVGTAVSLSGERVRQLEHEMLKRLREMVL
jgi:RNA polymerase sigma-32 factor